MKFHALASSVSLVLTIVISASVAFAEASTGFIENQGQVDELVRYYASGTRASIYFTQEGVVLDLKEEVAREADIMGSGHSAAVSETQESTLPPGRRGCAVWIRFEGANPLATIEARSKLATRYSYFLGRDPDGWRTNVPAFTEVVYRNLWPGIDLAYRAERDLITYELLVSPGADEERVSFLYEGIDRVTSLNDNTVLMETSVGSIADRRPAAGGGKGQIGWASRIGHGEGGSSEGPDRDESDLLWSTFLGGTEADAGAALELDLMGNPVVTGTTDSPDFPTTAGAYDESHNGNTDVFVAKLDFTGSELLWCTVLGDTSLDMGAALYLDDEENSIITGQTWSPEFPTTSGAYDEVHHGVCDAFVTKLSSDGSSLLWSTLLGASEEDKGFAICPDPSGNPVVAGYTSSSGFPTTPGAYDTDHYNAYDVFVATLDVTGSALIWSTFVGGNGHDRCFALTLDDLGNPVITGMTSSSNFPTTEAAYDTTYNNWEDVFLAKLDSTGSELLWGTYIGGARRDWAYALALDPWDNPVVTGFTWSDSFPTTAGAYDELYNGEDDVFVAMLDYMGSELIWSTYLGGSADEIAYSLKFDSSDNLVLTGSTRSADFPTTLGAYDEDHNGENDVFAAQLSSDGSNLLWSTFLGGQYWESGNALCLDDEENLVVVGTAHLEFPVTPGAYDESWNGEFDAFLCKIRIGETMSVDGSPFDSNTTMPVSFCLAGSSPNPFNPQTEIKYDLPVECHVRLEVYDLLGRRVATLVDEPMNPGTNVAHWDGRDAVGQQVSPGIYFCRFEAGDYTEIRKLTLLR